MAQIARHIEPRALHIAGEGSTIARAYLISLPSGAYVKWHLFLVRTVLGVGRGVALVGWLAVATRRQQVYIPNRCPE